MDVRNHDAFVHLEVTTVQHFQCRKQVFPSSKSRRGHSSVSYVYSNKYVSSHTHMLCLQAGSTTGMLRSALDFSTQIQVVSGLRTARCGMVWPTWYRVGHFKEPMAASRHGQENNQRSHPNWIYGYYGGVFAVRQHRQAFYTSSV